FAGDDLKAIGVGILAGGSGGLPVLIGVDALGQQEAGILAALSSHGERYVRVHPERQQLLLAADAVLHAPVLRAIGLYQQEQPLGVRQLVVLLGGLGGLNLGI